MNSQAASDIQEESSDPLLGVQAQPKLRVMDWLLTPIFFVAFITILLIFDVLQRIAHLFGNKALDKAVVGLDFALVHSLRLTGASFSFQGNNELPEGVPCIIVCNHQSMFDVPILYNLFRNNHPRFVSKKELSRWIPSISYYIRAGGSAIIDRSNRSQAINEIKQFGQRMRTRGFAAVLFPEGTRARDGKLKRFKPSGFLALAKEVPEALILPVTIDGSWKLTTRKRGPIPVGTHIRLSIGTLLNQKDFDKQDLYEEVCRQIRENLRDMRKANLH